MYKSQLYIVKKINKLDPNIDINTWVKYTLEDTIQSVTNMINIILRSYGYLDDTFVVNYEGREIEKLSYNLYFSLILRYKNFPINLDILSDSVANEIGGYTILRNDVTVGRPRSPRVMQQQTIPLSRTKK
ncbi:Hypothetical protein ORPV_360 [Orpheovirus IHUMI-LCC2]|uniref:Uncharacterized protein n=1 Tax=Orpheovirus IHUMI-LCC2 TaxID=2023057 RepID=A0A2I2L408_9VIRU|nr:Hypothetical protein ORPV_360 [Orpheovirus IHUMI-LCC2]SNW62264.1 Hypothetical protein ORPV_360 [Orpheovirus IHUMI-LCC2]